MGFVCSLLNNTLDFLLLHFGWYYLLYVHLPLGFVRRKFCDFQNWISLSLWLGIRRHPRKVLAIQKQVKQWNKKKERRKICTEGTDNCQRMCFSRPNYKRKCAQLKMGILTDIIEINAPEGFARVEPYVTVAQLLDALMPLGHTLPVMPEIGLLTVGGLILGGGVGSGSARHGLFQHNCIAFEIVTSSGEVLIAEKDGENQSLFFGIPWSLGSLGFLVSATLRIVPCPPFLKLFYQPCLSQKELVGRLLEESVPKKGNDFVEAIQFGNGTSVLICAKFAQKLPRNDRRLLNKFGQWHKPFFYKHAQRMCERGGIKIEYMPSGDYFRRHWRSLFWSIEQMVPLIGFFPLRLLVGWLLPPEFPLLTSQRSRRLFSPRQILQNFLVPLKALPKFTASLHQQFCIYPLWLCPVSLPAQPGLLRNRQGLSTVYVNVGLYGQFQSELSECNGMQSFEDQRERMRTVEGMVREVQGFQMLCADSHQTAAEFWDMFDATLYDWLRARYECKSAFLNVYEKICMDNREIVFK
ncbi:hypothetical protein niasHS_013478 [Heterodera schachtii]|uniref:Delta(24)-sterol reductase n=1 Tax=Heterodera schachtii TaxID=97005 RepID=A0ABD2IFA5_HETSC